jgi:hypothetical protein
MKIYSMDEYINVSVGFVCVSDIVTLRVRGT